MSCRRSSRIVLSTLIAFHASRAANAAPPATTKATTQATIAYAPPITITRGGVYTGNYRSDDSRVPAISIETNEPVEITGCHVLSSGTHVRAGGGSQLNIHDNTFVGQPPTDGGHWGRVLDDYHPQTLVFEHNTVEHTGGLYVDHSDANTRTITVRYNAIRDTDQSRADGKPGEHRAALMLNTVLPVEAEIAWNWFENRPGHSHVEDNINLYNSGGRRGAPIRIHDNFVAGAYPLPTSADHFTGSGITVEGDPGHVRFDDVSQHVIVSDNQVISTCNAGINVNAGHDITVERNTVVSAGVYPDGSAGGFFWAGVSVWNGSNAPPTVFRDIVIRDNTIGYNRPGYAVPFAGRQDTSGGVDLAQNVCLPNPITLDTERRVRDAWQAKLARAGVRCGNDARSAGGDAR